MATCGSGFGCFEDFPWEVVEEGIPIFYCFSGFPETEKEVCVWSGIGCAASAADVSLDED